MIIAKLNLTNNYYYESMKHLFECIHCIHYLVMYFLLNFLWPNIRHVTTLDE